MKNFIKIKGVEWDLILDASKLLAIHRKGRCLWIIAESKDGKIEYEIPVESHDTAKIMVKKVEIVIDRLRDRSTELIVSTTPGSLHKAADALQDEWVAWKELTKPEDREKNVDVSPEAGFFTTVGGIKIKIRLDVAAMMKNHGGLIPLKDSDDKKPENED